MVLEKFVTRIIHSVIRYDYREPLMHFSDSRVVKTETSGKMVGMRISLHNPRYWYPDNGNLIEIIWDTAKNEVRIYSRHERLYSLARDEFQQYGNAVRQCRGRSNFVDTPILRRKKS